MAGRFAPAGGAALTSSRPICTCTTRSAGRGARRPSPFGAAPRAVAVSALRGLAGAAVTGGAGPRYVAWQQSVSTARRTPWERATGGPGVERRWRQLAVREPRAPQAAAVVPWEARRRRRVVRAHRAGPPRSVRPCAGRSAPPAPDGPTRPVRRRGPERTGSVRPARRAPADRSALPRPARTGRAAAAGPAPCHRHPGHRRVPGEQPVEVVRHLRTAPGSSDAAAG